MSTKFPVARVDDAGAQQNFESLAGLLDQLRSLMFDTGDLRPTARASAPDGWLLCDGSAISRTDYAALFDEIGTTFGTGDGSTTFNVPDLAGRAPIGTGTGSGLTARALGAKVGTETHLLTAAQSGLRDHTHIETRPVAISQGFAGGNSINAGAIGSFSTGGVSGGLADAPASSAHPNMQPSLAVNWLIRT